MTSQTNKMKRELSLPPIIASPGLIVPYRSPFTEGCPELALPARSVQEPTTLLMESNTMEPPNGSSRAAHSRNGSQQDHCYGSWKACVSLAFLSINFLMTPGLELDRKYHILYSRIRKSVVIKKVMDRNAKETHAFMNP